MRFVRWRRNGDNSRIAPSAPFLSSDHVNNDDENDDNSRKLDRDWFVVMSVFLKRRLSFASIKTRNPRREITLSRDRSLQKSELG